MEVEHTYWTDKEIEACKEGGHKTEFLVCIDGGPYQPSFGLCIGWNEPKKLWKPFVVVDFWHWKVSIGWLF